MGADYGINFDQITVFLSVQICVIRGFIKHSTAHGGGGTLCWRVWIVGAGVLMSNQPEKLALRFAVIWHLLCCGVPSALALAEITADYMIYHVSRK